MFYEILEIKKMNDLITKYILNQPVERQNHLKIIHETIIELDKTI